MNNLEKGIYDEEKLIKVPFLEEDIESKKITLSNSKFLINGIIKLNSEYYDLKGLTLNFDFGYLKELGDNIIIGVEKGSIYLESECKEILLDDSLFVIFSKDGRQVLKNNNIIINQFAIEQNEGYLIFDEGELYYRKINNELAVKKINSQKDEIGGLISIIIALSLLIGNQNKDFIKEKYNKITSVFKQEINNQK